MAWTQSTLGKLVRQSKRGKLEALEAFTELATAMEAVMKEGHLSVYHDSAVLDLVGRMTNVVGTDRLHAVQNELYEAREGAYEAEEKAQVLEQQLAEANKRADKVAEAAEELIIPAIVGMAIMSR